MYFLEKVSPQVRILFTEFTRFQNERGRSRRFFSLVTFNYRFRRPVKCTCIYLGRHMPWPATAPVYVVSSPQTVIGGPKIVIYSYYLITSIRGDPTNGDFWVFQGSKKAERPL